MYSIVILAASQWAHMVFSQSSESLVFKVFDIETLYINHQYVFNISLFFLTYICEGKSDIRQNLVRYQSDLCHFRPKNLTYFKDFFSQTWPKSHWAL